MTSVLARTLVAIAALAVAATGWMLLRPAQNVGAALETDVVMAAAFASAAPDWQARVVQDETQRLCTRYRNTPPPDVAAAIMRREQATIVYPPDGRLSGDWTRGEAIAQSGYGLRFTDYPPARGIGGNCYACHQIDPAEVSFGTLGPSLMGYGAARKFAAADVKAVYERIYNPQAAMPCANMPRFGAAKILTIEQISDLVALVMSKDSPVNK